MNVSRHNSYGMTKLSGQANALLGNNYGQLNFQQTTVYLNSASSEHGERFPPRVVRHNQVFSGHTIETITIYQEGGILRAGSASQVQLRWDQCEDIGAGVFGEVHREEYCNNGEPVKSRAVKVLRRRQLDHLKVDYERARRLDAIIACMLLPELISQADKSV